jgi:hypothetical protein
VSDDDDRKKRLAKLIRDNVKPKEPGASAAPVSVNGNHNTTIALYGAKIVVRGPSILPDNRDERPKEKKTMWRTELEGEILRRVWDLAMTPDQFFELMSEKLGRHLVSMKDLSKRDLDAAYGIVAGMRRPALE